MLTDFRFDWGSFDREWLNDTQTYIFLRVDKGEKECLGLFAFTGKVVLEPIYQSIEIHPENHWFENPKQRVSALLNDYIIATDFEGKQFKWTHHQGLEELQGRD